MPTSTVALHTPLPRWGQQDASLLQIKPLKNGVQKIYPGYPHGMLKTNADIINPDLLAFIKG